MTQIVMKNTIDRKKLNTLLFLLKSWDIAAEVNTHHDIKKISAYSTSQKPLSLSLGMWADYDINDKTLRAKAWGINKTLPQ
jgi:hypothetical protein